MRSAGEVALAVSEDERVGGEDERVAEEDGRSMREAKRLRQGMARAKLDHSMPFAVLTKSTIFRTLAARSSTPSSAGCLATS